MNAPPMNWPKGGRDGVGVAPALRTVNDAAAVVVMVLSHLHVEGGEGVLDSCGVFGVEVGGGASGRAGRKTLQAQAGFDGWDERNREQGVDDRVQPLPQFRGAGEVAC
jgi:hypothetical protein